MTTIKLEHYFGIPENEIVKIKLRTHEDFVYGRIAIIGQLGPASGPFSAEQGTSVTMSKINDYVEFLKSPEDYIGLTLLRFNTGDIESIDILEVQMNSKEG